jgi:hypothetical protein
MHKALARAMLPLVSVGMAQYVGAQASADSFHRDSAAPLAVAPTSEGAPKQLAMPSDVRGYQLTDSTALGGADAGVQYVYTRNKKDQVNVFVAPYQSDDKLGNREDTTNYVVGDVDAYYQSLEMAARQGNIDRFQLLHAARKISTPTVTTLPPVPSGGE